MENLKIIPVDNCKFYTNSVDVIYAEDLEDNLTLKKLVNDSFKEVHLEKHSYNEFIELQRNIDKYDDHILFFCNKTEYFYFKLFKISELTSELELKEEEDIEENDKEISKEPIAHLLLESLKTEVLSKGDILLLLNINKYEQEDNVKELHNAILDFKNRFATTVNWYPDTITVSDETDVKLKELLSEINKLEVFEKIEEPSQTSNIMEEDICIDTISKHEVLKLLYKKMYK